MAPLVSILIPTYNRSRLLSRAIQSAFAQTYPNYEIVVSDNSDDNSAEQVVIQLSNQKLRYFKNPHNIGPVLNWRNALELATGEYCVILPDDDYFLNPFYLEHGIELLTEKGCSLLIPNSVIISEDDDRGKVRSTNLCLPEVVNGETYLKHFWTKNYQMPTIANIFRKSLALEVDAFVDNSILYSDIECWLKMFSLTDVCFYRVPSVAYSFHGENIVFNMTRDQFIQNSRFVTNVAEFRARNSMTGWKVSSGGDVAAPLIVRYINFVANIDASVLDNSSVRAICKINGVDYRSIIRDLRYDKIRRGLRQAIRQLRESVAIKRFLGVSDG